VTRTAASALTASVLLGAAMLAVAAQGRSLSNSQTFPDSDTAAESATNVDLTSIVVSNDDVGDLTLRANVGNQPTLTSQMAVTVYIDADRSAATGVNLRGAGIDYGISLTANDKVTFFQPSGGKLVATTPPPSLSAHYDGSAATFQVNARDIGNTKSFAFAASSVAGHTNGADLDYAPEGASPGTFVYDVKIAVTLHSGRLTLTPSPARAGKRLTVSLPVTESDTNGPITTGKVQCAASLGNKQLAIRSGGVANGVASCRVLLPRAAKGKIVKGRITVVVEGVKLTKHFSAHVS